MPTNAMRYLSSISLALIVHVLLSIVVLMALACTATPATPAPTPDVPKYTDTEVLQVLENWAKSTKRKDKPSWSAGTCWNTVSMERHEYTVTQSNDGSSVYWVVGVHTAGGNGTSLEHTWTVTIDDNEARSYKYSDSRFEPTGLVKPTTATPFSMETGC